jgi:hypothetical protein
MDVAIMGLPILGFVLVFALIVALIAAWFHGAILTFRASILLGILGLCLGVPFAFIGLIYWCTGGNLNIPQALVGELKTLEKELGDG